jgi:Ca2+-binding EF-hand superfamily protein
VTETFLERKIARCFDLLDRNNDGDLSRDDCVALARAATDASGFPADSDYARRVHDAYVRLWEVLLAPMDADRDGRLSKQEFLSLYRATFPSLGQDEILDAFGHLDRDGDGHINREEMSLSIGQYLTSEDVNAPGNWFLGRVET